MRTRPALVVATALLASVLAGCGSNHGNGDNSNTNDASPNPVCRLGTDQNGNCLSAPPYTPTASPVSPSPSVTKSAEDHHHHGKHHH